MLSEIQRLSGKLGRRPVVHSSSFRMILTWLCELSLGTFGLFGPAGHDDFDAWDVGEERLWRLGVVVPTMPHCPCGHLRHDLHLQCMPDSVHEHTLLDRLAGYLALCSAVP